MKIKLLKLAAVLILLAVASPLLAADCDAELNQCLADCQSFGNPPVGGRTCTSACVWYYERCVNSGGTYCGPWGTGSGCYDPY